MVYVGAMWSPSNYSRKCFQNKIREGQKAPGNSLCVSRPGDDSKLRWFVDRLESPPLCIPILPSTFSWFSHSQQTSTQPSSHVTSSEDFSDSLPQGEFISPAFVFREYSALFISLDTIFYLFMALSSWLDWEPLKGKLALPNSHARPPSDGQHCPLTSLCGLSLPWHWTVGPLCLWVLLSSEPWASPWACLAAD